VLGGFANANPAAHTRLGLFCFDGLTTLILDGGLNKHKASHALRASFLFPVNASSKLGISGK